MARLQILELPEGSGDDRPPFVLVVDQADYDSLSSLSAALEGWQNLKEEIGARAVLVFEEAIDIPANDVPLDPDGHPVKLRIEPDFETFRQQVQDEIRKAQNELRQAINQDAASERTEIARDMDRLAKRKNQLLDALGMDHTRDWDDIRNAARGLRKKSDDQAAKIERIIRLPETPQQGAGFETDDYLKGYQAAIRRTLAALIGPIEDVLTPDA